MYKNLNCNNYVDFRKYSIDELIEYTKKIQQTRIYALTCTRLRKLHSEQCVGMLDKGHFHQIDYSEKLHKHCDEIIKKINDRIQKIKQSCKKLETKINSL
jgi:hypothetical protein